MENRRLRFLHRLALKLGMFVETVEKMSAKELVRWEAFYYLEPWGTEIEDARFGKLMSVHTGKSPDEHFPGYYKPEIDQTKKNRVVEKLKAAFRGK